MLSLKLLAAVSIAWLLGVTASVVACSESNVPATATPRAIASTPTVVATAIDEVQPSASISRDHIRFVETFGAYEWDRPLDMAFMPDGKTALVAEQVGDIYQVTLDSSAKPELFISIAERVSRKSNEEGLLSIALDPNFDQNNRIWVYYSAQRGLRSTRLAWINIDEYREHWSNEHLVLELIQPFPNHNGGKILFDDRGYLYLGLGDGGSAGDPQNNGQNLENIFGTIIRLDVNATNENTPYAIPPDNPFIAPEHQNIPDEIWAYGLRNPWRMSIDNQTGMIWIADVGQSYREEINAIDTATGSGTNFGWSRMEGTACFKPRRDCDQSDIQLPVHDYAPRSGNCSVTGGYVYRGSDIPQLNGYYLYADHCRGQLIAIDAEKPQLDRIILGDIAPLGDKYDDPRITSFAQDNQNELYVLRFDGPILKITPAENLIP